MKISQSNLRCNHSHRIYCDTMKKQKESILPTLNVARMILETFSFTDSLSMSDKTGMILSLQNITCCIYSTRKKAKSQQLIFWSHVMGTHTFSTGINVIMTIIHECTRCIRINQINICKWNLLKTNIWKDLHVYPGMCIY